MDNIYPPCLDLLDVLDLVSLLLYLLRGGLEGELQSRPGWGPPHLFADVSICTWLSKTGSCPVEINTGASICGPSRDTNIGSF